MLGVSVFAVFVHSPQGAALAERYRDGQLSRVIVACLVASWLAVAVASLLALIAASRQAPQQPVNQPDARAAAGARIFPSGLWIVILSSAPGVLFAQSVAIWAAWFAVGMLVAVGAVIVFWMTAHGEDRTTAAASVLGSIQGHRVLSIALASTLAIAPLALGALISMTRPVQLADAGPLLVGMVGTSNIATLLGLISWRSSPCPSADDGLVLLSLERWSGGQQCSRCPSTWKILCSAMPL